jgi:hypothetical protein
MKPSIKDLPEDHYSLGHSINLFVETILAETHTKDLANGATNLMNTSPRYCFIANECLDIIKSFSIPRRCKMKSQLPARTFKISNDHIQKSHSATTIGLGIVYKKNIEHTPTLTARQSHINKANRIASELDNIVSGYPNTNSLLNKRA